MVIDIVKFFFIYTLVLFAFACGLTQLLWYYNDLEKQKCYSLPGGLPDWSKQGDACMKWRRFHNLFEASQSLFWAGFGMVGLDDFELTGIREYTRFWSMLMFGSYSVINIIVLLNLLIAMMSSSYSFIVEHADTEWKFARTKLWMSYFNEGNTLPPPFNIFPTVKSCLKLFLGGKSRKESALKRMSTKTRRSRSRARDYRYLAVMRALIWRYVRSLQRRNEERPVNEDDISEVKGDISALRFELIDLFDGNGMDVSMCAKKSRAALGRKMKVWERQLMRDFHLSPAMGSETVNQVKDTTSNANVEGQKPASAALSKFKRAAHLAISDTGPSMANIVLNKTKSSQIGCGSDPNQESLLRTAMERARRQLEECTPDGSPNSSRGCSPFPDLYTGPHLLETIKSLSLTPHPSPSETPLPGSLSTALRRELKDGQAKDPNLLTIPGRRSPCTLKKPAVPDISINEPGTIFSAGAFKNLRALEKTQQQEEIKDKIQDIANKKELNETLNTQLIETKPENVPIDINVSEKLQKMSQIKMADAIPKLTPPTVTKLQETNIQAFQGKKTEVVIKSGHVTAMRNAAEANNGRCQIKEDANNQKTSNDAIIMQPQQKREATIQPLNQTVFMAPKQHEIKPSVSKPQNVSGVGPIKPDVSRPGINTRDSSVPRPTVGKLPKSNIISSNDQKLVKISPNTDNKVELGCHPQIKRLQSQSSQDDDLETMDFVRRPSKVRPPPPPLPVSQAPMISVIPSTPMPPSPAKSHKYGILPPKHMMTPPPKRSEKHEAQIPIEMMEVSSQAAFDEGVKTKSDISSEKQQVITSDDKLINKDLALLPLQDSSDKQVTPKPSKEPIELKPPESKPSLPTPTLNRNLNEPSVNGKLFVKPGDKKAGWL